MVQIIGFLGCVYLVIKALEIAGSSAFRNSEGSMTQYATFACIVAWLSAVGFAWAFVAQGGEIESAISNITSTDSGIDTSRYPKGPEGYIQCHSDAKGLDQQVECGKLMR